MTSSQIVSLAPHTVWHPDMARSGPDTWREVADSRKRILKETGSVANLFAYPFGNYPSMELEAFFSYLKAIGMEAAFLTQPGVIDSSSHPYLLPRVPISGHDTKTLFLLKLLWPEAVFKAANLRRFFH